MEMIDQLLELDSALLLYLNNLGHPSWDAFWFAVTHKLTFVPLYMFLLYLMSKNLNKKGVVLLVFSLAAMITFTDQVTNLFKSTFQRLRPCAQDGIVELLRLGIALVLVSFQVILPIQWPQLSLRFLCYVQNTELTFF